MKKLLLLLLTIMFSYCIFAQNNGEIIYTDFKPDLSIILNSITTPSGPQFGDSDTLCLDFNEDGIKDMKFYYDVCYKLYYCPVADMYNYNEWRCGFVINDTIPNNQINSRDLNFMSNVIVPNLLDTIHLGVKHQINNNLYYGWLVLYVGSFTDDFINFRNCMIVDEMAFCTIPNYPLKFGQNSFIGINEIDAPSTSVNAFYNNGTGTLKIKSDMEINNIEVIDVLGRTLYRKVNMASDSFEADLSGFTNGIYIVRAVLSDKTATSTKFVIYGSK